MNSIIIGIVAWWIAEGCGLIQLLKWWLKERKIWYTTNHFNIEQERRLKPLDCPLCLGWWIGLIHSYSLTQDISYSIVMGVLSSCVAIVVSKLMSKL
jgi:hypothetical protein